LAIGMACSAFFSGSETGFYRATRVRLVIQARNGDWIARGLLVLANNPALFVATTLIGNNVANYVTSLAVVLLTQELASASSSAMELTATVLFSPLVFVYGELLPKNLYYRAPNLLLRRGGPLLLTFAVLFSPIAIVLSLLGYMLQKMMGEAPLRVRLTLARKELQQILREGQEAGILKPTQRRVAQSLFTVATVPISRYMAPVNRTASVRLGCSREAALALASRTNAPLLVVKSAEGADCLGYVQVIDLRLAGDESITDVRPLLRLKRSDSFIDALLRFQQEKEELAVVIDANGKPVGLLHARELAKHLFREER